MLIGKIWDEYRLDQAVRDRLGAPSSSILGGQGDAQNFQRGAIFAASSGTHTVFGAIFTTYQANGGATGRLGLPVGDEQAISERQRPEVHRQHHHYGPLPAPSSAGHHALLPVPHDRGRGRVDPQGIF